MCMRKMWRQKMAHGSMTVEAAAVMPLILLVIFGSLYLCFFVHNRAWLTAAAYETALTGSMEAVKTDGKIFETADMKMHELGSVGFFGSENLTGQTQTGSKQVSVFYDLDTISVYGGFRWHLRVNGKSKIIRPVKTIRKIKGAAEVFRAIEG